MVPLSDLVLVIDSSSPKSWSQALHALIPNFCPSSLFIWLLSPWQHFLLIRAFRLLSSHPLSIPSLDTLSIFLSVVNHFNNAFACTLNSLILCFCVRGSHKVSTVEELSLLHLFQSSWAIKSTTVYGSLVRTNVIVIKLGSTIFLLDLPTSRISEFKLSPFSSRPLSLLPPHSINSSLLPGSYFT